MGGMTAFSLQVTSQGGIMHQDAREWLDEMVTYWDQEQASSALQLALEQMRWPTYAEGMSRPSKRGKNS
jgi:hypothetical protein